MKICSINIHFFSLKILKHLQTSIQKDPSLRLRFFFICQEKSNLPTASVIFKQGEVIYVLNLCTNIRWQLETFFACIMWRAIGLFRAKKPDF